MRAQLADKLWVLDAISEALQGCSDSSLNRQNLFGFWVLRKPKRVSVAWVGRTIAFEIPARQLMRAGIYVHPATHSTGPTSGGTTAPPYGARLRLKASKDVSSLNAAARVVANALEKYGMILSDGGNITFTAMASDYTTASWSQVGLGTQDMKSLQWTRSRLHMKFRRQDQMSNSPSNRAQLPSWKMAVPRTAGAWGFACAMRDREIGRFRKPSS